MKHTVIALFDANSAASQAAKALTGRGFASAAVHVSQRLDPDETMPLPAAAEIEGGPASGLLNRLARLFGTEETHVAHYVEGVRRGGCVVTVDADDEAQATSARDVLLAHGAVNIDDRLGEWRAAGWDDAAVPTSAATGTPGMVHRHEVSSGGVRVYRRGDGDT